MTYICYMFCKGGVEICVLAVRDNERDMGDNEVASSVVVKGGHADGSWEQLNWIWK